MNLESKVEVALEIVNSLIADFSLTNEIETGDYVATLISYRDLIYAHDEETVDFVIKNYGHIIKEEVKSL